MSNKKEESTDFSILLETRNPEKLEDRTGSLSAKNLNYAHKEAAKVLKGNKKILSFSSIFLLIVFLGLTISALLFWNDIFG